MMGAIERHLRGGWNLFLFTVGAREYHWALSPLQQIVNYVASLASRQRDKPFWQRVAVYCYALLKYRENHYFDGMNFVGRLHGPASQRTLRNFALWQDRMIRNQELPPGFKFNAVLLVAEGEEVQTDRLFSALCLSDTVNGLSIFWDEDEANRSFRAPFGLTEAESLRWRAGEDVFDLDMAMPVVPGQVSGGQVGSRKVGAGRAPAPPPGGMARDQDRELLAAERDGVPRAFHPSLDPKRQVTHFIKIAHPRGYRLAVSLPEDRDGFADRSLQDWLPHLVRLTERQDRLTICLLNRFVQGADGEESLPRGIHAIRQAGLTEQDVLAFAMEAEGFFGCLDIYGLAARSAHRPGIFVPLDGLVLDDRGHAVPRPSIEIADTHAPEMFAALRDWWREAGAADLARHMQSERRLPKGWDRRVRQTDNGPAAPNAAGLDVMESGFRAENPEAGSTAGASAGSIGGDGPDGVGARDGVLRPDRSTAGRGSV